LYFPLPEAYELPTAEKPQFLSEACIAWFSVRDVAKMPFPLLTSTAALTKSVEYFFPRADGITKTHPNSKGYCSIFSKKPASQEEKKQPMSPADPGFQSLR
jgi:hypothetical protein